MGRSPKRCNIWPRSNWRANRRTRAGLEVVLSTGLEKDPDKRWQSAREVKQALEWMTQRTAPVETVQAALPAKGILVWQGAAALLALTALGLAGWMFRPRHEPPVQVFRFQVPLPEKATFGQYVSLSLDGRKMAVNTTDGLWIRNLDALDWRLLPGTEDGASPFWSPDSRFVGFASRNQLKKIDVTGGPAQTLCSVPNLILRSGTWNSDGVILFGGREGSPIWKISQAGGVPTALTVPDIVKGETFHTLPVFLPDGKHFFYLRQGKKGVAGIYGGSLDAKPAEQSRERILTSDTGAAYVNGNLFFMRENTLMVQPFDSGRLELRGEPVPLVERVATFGAYPVFSVSSGGTLAWHTGVRTAHLQLTWFDRQGKILSTFEQPGTDQALALSPDGTRAVVRDAQTRAMGDLWTIDFARGVGTRVPFRKSAGT